MYLNPLPFHSPSIIIPYMSATHTHIHIMETHLKAGESRLTQTHLYNTNLHTPMNTGPPPSKGQSLLSGCWNITCYTDTGGWGGVICIIDVCVCACMCVSDTGLMTRPSQFSAGAFSLWENEVCS